MKRHNEFRSRSRSLAGNTVGVETAATVPNLGVSSGHAATSHPAAQAPQRYTRSSRSAITILGLLLALGACADAPTTPEMGTVTSYLGGGEPPVKPKPEEPKPDTSTPPEPEPEPVPGTMELRAQGAFAPLTDGTCLVDVRGTAQGGYIDILRVAVSPQVLGEGLQPPVYFPGAYLLPGQRWRLREVFATTGPTDFNVALQLRDGSVIGYRRICR